MSSSAPDFNKLFEENMKKLAKIKTDIESGISTKSAFSKTVLAELQDINKRLNEVRGNLNTLKSRLVDLEGRIRDKDSEIIDKGTNCADLQEENVRLKAAVDSLQLQLADMKETYREQFDVSKAEYEKNKKAIEAERDLLKRNLDDVQRRLQNELAKLEETVRENDQLKKQHSALSTEINDIEQKIASLNGLDVKTQGDLTAQIQTIKSILVNLEQDVSTSGTGSSSSKVKTIGEVVIKKPLNEMLAGLSQTMLDRVEWNTMKLREIITNLYNRPAYNNDGVNQSKYSKALAAILRGKGSMNNAELDNIFTIYKITDLTRDELEGGKKSRKTRKTRKTRMIRRRKQKGGYTYSEKTKRRTFSSSPRTSSPRTSSSRTSSRRSSTLSSSQNDRPKRKSRKTL